MFNIFLKAEMIPLAKWVASVRTKWQRSFNGKVQVKHYRLNINFIPLQLGQDFFFKSVAHADIYKISRYQLSHLKWSGCVCNLSTKYEWSFNCNAIRARRWFCGRVTETTKPFCTAVLTHSATGMLNISIVLAKEKKTKFTRPTM